MKQYIGCDAHSRYSVFVSVDETRRIGPPVRIDHLGGICGFIFRAWKRKRRLPWRPEAAGIG